MRKLGKIKINIKEPTPTAAERLHQSQQAIRKEKGLPDPSHYKKMAAQKQAEIDSMKEEKQPEAIKPRNFVAKNAKTSGAGKHKDVKKAIQYIRDRKHKGKMEEEVEQLDELSKSTLGSYTRAAALDLTKRSFSVGQKSGKANWSENPEHRKYDITKDQDKKKTVNRVSGITKASMRLANEEAEQLDEMPESGMKTRDVHAHLKSKGWSIARTSGGHDIYKHPKARNVIAVPRHKQLKAPLIKGILKSSHVSEEVMDEQLVKKGRFYSGEVKKPFKSNTIVPSIKEAIKVGGIGYGGSKRKSYGSSHGMDSAEGDTLENIPFHPKTEKDKRIKAALSDIGDKMKAKYPNLAKEDIGGPITVIKKGTNIKQKISPNSYETFKHHGFRKESAQEPTEGEMRDKQGISRRAQIVKDAAKGKKTDSPDKFQKDPELSSEIHKT